MVWNDQFQGAANALYAQELGLKNVFVLNDSETYGLGIANLFIKSAEQLGIKIAGNQKWDKKASSYESVASRIKASGADGIFLGGIICNNGGKLIKDLRAAMPGTHDPRPGRLDAHLRDHRGRAARPRTTCTSASRASRPTS